MDNFRNKKIFRKAPYRIQLFEKMLPTSFATFTNYNLLGYLDRGSVLLKKHLFEIKDVIVALPNDSAAIKKMKKLFRPSKVQQKLEVIHKNFKCLVISVKKIKKSEPSKTRCNKRNTKCSKYNFSIR